MASSYTPPCAACKFLRRKCIQACIFSSYFPPEDPRKFANVHKIFGASNVSKLLLELLPHQRNDAVNSLAYEAEARVRDPVYGCVAAISLLQGQVDRLQRELDEANADLIRLACNDLQSATAPVAHVAAQMEFGRRSFGDGLGVVSGRFYQTPGVQIPWNYDHIYNLYGGAMDGGY